MAPTTARVTATLIPAKMFGSALGNRILTKIFRSPAPIERARWSISGSTERSPTTVSMTIGKNEMAKATSTLGKMPRPAQKISSGAMAILGTDCEATSSGYTVRSNSGE